MNDKYRLATVRMAMNGPSMRPVMIGPGNPKPFQRITRTRGNKYTTLAMSSTSSNAGLRSTKKSTVAALRPAGSVAGLFRAFATKPQRAALVMDESSKE